MTEYYKDKLEKGLEFQDFCIELLLSELGLAITPYCSRAYQIRRGETRQGAEIKYDMRLHETGNLFIEIAEKSSVDMPFYTNSGIYRTDNTWLYVIGDYSKVYIFAKNLLRHIHKTGRYREIEIKRKTSKGFLLPPEKQKHAAKIIETGLPYNWQTEEQGPTPVTGIFEETFGMYEAGWNA